MCLEEYMKYVGVKISTLNKIYKLFSDDRHYNNMLLSNVLDQPIDMVYGDEFDEIYNSGFVFNSVYFVDVYYSKYLVSYKYKFLEGEYKLAMPESLEYNQFFSIFSFSYSSYFFSR